MNEQKGKRVGFAIARVRLQLLDLHTLERALWPESEIKARSRT